MNKNNWTIEEDRVVCSFCLENKDLDESDKINLSSLIASVQMLDPDRTKGTIRTRYLNFLYLATDGRKGLKKVKKQQIIVYKEMCKK